MKHLPTIFNAVLSAVLIFLALSFGMPAAHAQASQAALPAQQSCDSSRSIQVSGSAVVNVAPDRALIQLGVQSNGGSPQAVESDNSASIQNVINSVRSLGVESKDIATDVYVIEPIYEDYDSLQIKGYRIHNEVAITLRDVSKTSQLISAALQAGANQVVNVDLYTSELRKYRDQAREMAMKAANEKASALSSAVGAQISCVLSINENSWSAYNGWWSGRSQNQMTQNAVQNIAPNPGQGVSVDAETVSLGQISVRADVNVSFGLK